MQKKNTFINLKTPGGFVNPLETQTKKLILTKPGKTLAKATLVGKAMEKLESEDAEIFQNNHFGIKKIPNANRILSGKGNIEGDEHTIKNPEPKIVVTKQKTLDGKNVFLSIYNKEGANIPIQKEIVKSKDKMDTKIPVQKVSAKSKENEGPKKSQKNKIQIPDISETSTEIPKKSKASKNNKIVEAQKELKEPLNTNPIFGFSKDIDEIKQKFIKNDYEDILSDELKEKFLQELNIKQNNKPYHRAFFELKKALFSCDVEASTLWAVMLFYVFPQVPELILEIKYFLLKFALNTIFIDDVKLVWICILMVNEEKVPIINYLLLIRAIAESKKNQVSLYFQYNYIFSKGAKNAKKQGLKMRDWPDYKKDDKNLLKTYHERVNEENPDADIFTIIPIVITYDESNPEYIPKLLCKNIALLNLDMKPLIVNILNKFSKIEIPLLTFLFSTDLFGIQGKLPTINDISELFPTTLKKEFKAYLIKDFLPQMDINGIVAIYNSKLENEKIVIQPENLSTNFQAEVLSNLINFN